MAYRNATTAQTKGRDFLRKLRDDVDRLMRQSAAIGAPGVPSGAVMQFAATTAPDGWVLCDGTLYDGTDATYANLFAAIGLAYGGSGTNFRVPDGQGRVLVGVGTHADVSALNDTEGLTASSRSPKHNSTNSLTLPDHAHGTSDPGHAHNSSVGQFKANVTVGTGITDQEGAGNQTLYPPATATATTGLTVTGITSTPPINGSIGPGGSRPTDTPAFVTVNHIIKL